jgi:uracil phosphoribosyltransferase
MQNNVHIMDHPLITHKITMLRDKNTNTKDFRQLVYEIALLMGYEATKNLSLMDTEITTPLMTTTQKVLCQKVAIIPILRAGLGMVDGVLSLIPSAKVGHIGLYRDHETLQPVEYYCKVPSDIASREVIVVDPMLATGGSGAAAISFLKQRGAKSIKLMCIIAAPEGLKKMREAHPDVKIYCGALDESLNEKGYILPGLGDAGDRIFGTL